jgi:hypothetical protein
MAKYVIDDSTLTGIADAIRGKTSGTEPIAVLDMARQIEDIKIGGGDIPADGEEWFGDGNTHLWISLPEGRTSPMLGGVCPNGTVTVDWGDGSTPDVLRGSSLTSVRWTSAHKYAQAGDYVITLTVNGTMGLKGSSGGGILRYSSTDSDSRNRVYRNALRKVEIGNGVTSIAQQAFYLCCGLTSIIIPKGVTSIGQSAFGNCDGLTTISIPDGVTSIGTTAFYACHSLKNIIIPNSVTSINSEAFSNCNSLTSIIIPKGVTSIGQSAFYGCPNLASITIPDSVTSIEASAFRNCWGLGSVISLGGVANIGANAFNGCLCVAVYDFTHHTTVPTLASTSAFDGIPADCKIRVPAALADEWKAAANWSTYAAKIVGV